MANKTGKYVNALENHLLIGTHLVEPNESVHVQEFMESHPQWDTYFRDAQFHIEKGNLVDEAKHIATKKKVKVESAKTILDHRALARLSESEVDGFVNQPWKVFQKAVEEVDDKNALTAYLDAALRQGKSNAMITTIQKRISTLANQ